MYLIREKLYRLSKTILLDPVITWGILIKRKKGTIMCILTLLLLLFGLQWCGKAGKEVKPESLVT